MSRSGCWARRVGNAAAGSAGAHSVFGGQDWTPDGKRLPNVEDAPATQPGWTRGVRYASQDTDPFPAAVVALRLRRRQPLSSHDGGARQSGAGTVAPRQGETHYTRHATATTRAEIIALRINGPFGLGDRAGVFRAVNEWNVALKGFVRFEIVLESSPKPAGKTWTVVAAQGNAPQSTLAFMPLPAAG
jgi:hypothetical protein